MVIPTLGIDTNHHDHKIPYQLSRYQQRERTRPGLRFPGIVIHQLRTYEIFEHNKAAFHARFGDHAWRIMRRYGFRIVGSWETKVAARTEFVYLLEWPDESVMRASWDSFMADAEWTEIKRVTSAEHGALVGDIEEKVLVATPYSPTLHCSSPDEYQSN